MNKILAIIRTSTERQETESQKYDLEAFCKSKEYDEEQIVYIESAGASARKLNAKYLKFLEDIKETIQSDKDIKAVAMWHLNRLGRVEKCLQEMKDFFIDNHIQVYVKEPSITLFDEKGDVISTNDMAWSMFATMIKYDTQELMTKTERGRAKNRREKKFNGGAFGALYGYEIDDNKLIVPCPSEKKVLNDIYVMYASGKYSIRSLVKELNERGVNMRGRKFTEANLSKVLSNTSYIGKRVFVYKSKENDKEIIRTFEREYYPIIDKWLWDKVEKVRKQNDLNIRKTKESRNINLAIKLLKCKQCGHNYVATKNKYTCYKHLMKQRFDEDCSNSVSISIMIMDKLLWGIGQIKHLDFILNNGKEQIKNLKKEKRIISQKIEKKKKDFENIKIKYDRAKELYMNLEINKENYDKSKSKINAEEKQYIIEIESMENELKTKDRQIYEIENFDWNKFVNIASDLEGKSNMKEKKEIVNTYIKECYVERTSFNGRNAIEIEINCYDGSQWKYMYCYTYKEKEKQLYIYSNGKYINLTPTYEQREQYKHNMIFETINKELTKAKETNDYTTLISNIINS